MNPYTNAPTKTSILNSRAKEQQSYSKHYFQYFFLHGVTFHATCQSIGFVHMLLENSLEYEDDGRGALDGL